MAAFNSDIKEIYILQELGGNDWWFDRFLAQHIAIFYYLMTVFMYAISPRMACKSMITIPIKISLGIAFLQNVKQT